MAQCSSAGWDRRAPERLPHGQGAVVRREPGRVAGVELPAPGASGRSPRRGGPLSVLVPLQVIEAMTRSVDSPAVSPARERLNIFAAPNEPVAAVATAAQPAGPAAIFGPRPTAASSSDRRGRRPARGGKRLPSGGLPIRGAVCLAAILAAATTLLALDSLGSELNPSDPGERQPSVAASTASRSSWSRRPNAPARGAEKRARARRSGRRRDLALRRSARSRRCCRRSRPPMHRIRRDASPKAAPLATPSPPPVSAQPSPAPATGEKRDVTPAPVPAGTPPEFM